LVGRGERGGQGAGRGGCWELGRGLEKKNYAKGGEEVQMGERRRGEVGEEEGIYTLRMGVDVTEREGTIPSAPKGKASCIQPSNMAYCALPSYSRTIMPFLTITISNSVGRSLESALALTVFSFSKCD
jgi:hypothetical protein